VLDQSGIPISTAPDYQVYPALAFGDADYLVVWTDKRNGVQYHAHPWDLKAKTEDEGCYATYYDVAPQVPDEFKFPCPDYWGGPTKPDGSPRTCYFFNKTELTQEPNSHHSIIHIYRGKFMDNRLKVNLGVRAPFFKRALNQYCYTFNGTSAWCDTINSQLVFNAYNADVAAHRAVGAIASNLTNLLKGPYM